MQEATDQDLQEWGIVTWRDLFEAIVLEPANGLRHEGETEADVKRLSDQELFRRFALSAVERELEFGVETATAPIG